MSCTREPAAITIGRDAVVARQDGHVRRDDALAATGPDQRDALALRYGSGLRFAEVGRSLARSESAAKMLVQRGLAALRAGMNEERNR